ncbi:hypothetical protein KJI95_14265 [Shewanella sp. JM162201]|uniref:Uncharacterized protein n=1 Tax=Shewanella jiangmenensis TaxID=2837387 RepID=A0ABS5V5D8_9GAMM|nr:hypothetical protein [Shewanella jiangmenensis]MBT1445675.1 hypothetical protein [Shewanella jiangmenensis]
MSYKFDGHEISVAFPVNSISLNKSSIAFTDKRGSKRQTFKKRTEALKFMQWLLSSNK